MYWENYEDQFDDTFEERLSDAMCDIDTEDYEQYLNAVWAVDEDYDIDGNEITDEQRAEAEKVIEEFEDNLQWVAEMNNVITSDIKRELRDEYQYQNRRARKAAKVG